MDGGGTAGDTVHSHRVPGGTKCESIVCMAIVYTPIHMPGRRGAPEPGYVNESRSIGFRVNLFTFYTSEPPM